MNGLIEQRGHINASTSDSVVVTFYVQFNSSDSYSVVALNTKYDGTQRDVLRITVKNYNNMTVQDYQITSGSSDMKGADWIVKGY